MQQVKIALSYQNIIQSENFHVELFVYTSQHPAP